MADPRDIIAAALVATHDADWRAKGLGRGPDITNPAVAAAYLRDADAVVTALSGAGLLIDRAALAKRIRAHAGKLTTRAVAVAGTAPPGADDHPFLIGLEYAARLIEDAEHG